MTSSFGRSFLVCAVIAAMLVAPVAAETFVSLNGHFRITYPDGWRQIDYNTAELFLFQGVPQQQRTDFEAVFAPQEVNPWFADAYLVLVVDTLSEVSPWHIDSTLLATSDALQKPTVYRSKADLFTDLSPGQLRYDSVSKTAVALIERVTGEDTRKSSLFAFRFFDRGVANFFFYTPDSTFQSNVAVLSDITASLSTEDLEAAMPRETLKVASAKDIESRSHSSSSPSIWILAAGLLLILMAVAIFMVRRRQLARK